MATILVIDDERMLCDLLQALLQRNGHDVYTAYSGREGIEAHKQRQPGCTLLDLHLPDMSGIEVLTCIREHDPQSAVMILTGAGSDKLEREARNLGVTDFPIKGLSPDVLIGAVARAVQPQAPSTGIPPATEKGDCILVVDDERQFCDMLKKYLTPRGFRVYTALDGPTALALADKERPQLVVLDIHMPGMNGVDVLRALRARQYAGGVMMLTGSEDQHLLHEALDLGSIDIVGKPTSLERIELAIQVSVILAKR